MSNVKFNRKTTTTMKFAGLIDTDRGVIDTGVEELSLMTLISAFNGAEAEVTIKVMSDTELDIPEADED